MLFSAKAEYACLAMLELAARYGDPKPVRLADVADRHGISHTFLVQILLQLKGAGLVGSTRGAAGGYLLARPPADITLADVLNAVDGSEASAGKRTKPADEQSDPSPLATALHGVWGKIQQAEQVFLTAQQVILEQTSLADLIDAGQGLQYVI